MSILTIEEIKMAVKPIVKKYNISKLYLFGSYARGEADEQSDVDLVFEAEDYFRVIRAEVELEEVLGKPVDLINMKQIKGGDSPISLLTKENFERENLLIA